ncbi:hypothetical protein BDBG_06472 [Blastomyces gilchristii SLH14081]|uniref:Protein kinase domain-containing protein n=1 Tax=Blastomyces gilchristii (strain SLH14081) TaxID=559298 RepID=A0A179UUA9_BLAGS|nr:uncharacterized protein BDBG_06472 [Blastomyces gilchristii SLH14081]OAT10657.1 hypothetical protein BDBG_06472 [Blastomyces gilchristii SLH14081]
MDLQHASSAKRKRTCWTLWLQHHKEKCPFINDLSHLSPDIEFLELLFAGSHSYLFKVQLGGEIYTLKLYNLTQPDWSESRFERNAWEKDPFIVECQVYDFLIENELGGVVGPCCYGWLVLDKTQEQCLEWKFSKPLEWRRRADTTGDPIRGLLLEYIDGCTIDKARVTAAGARSLRDQLDHLHNMDIAHGDLFPRNIMGSNDGRAFLVDFSSAKLFPHSSFMLRKREDFLDYTRGEKCVLELLLFRLQQVKPFPLDSCEFLAYANQLERHQGMAFCTAQSEEQAYGRPVCSWASANYAVVESLPDES